MDAGIGGDSGNLWLFGGTGNFNRISETVGEDGKSEMDNIVYGIRDRDFPNFVSKSSPPLLSGNANFVFDAATIIGTNTITPTIDQSTLCKDTTGDNYPICEITNNTNLILILKMVI